MFIESLLVYPVLIFFHSLYIHDNVLFATLMIIHVHELSLTHLYVYSSLSPFTKKTFSTLVSALVCYYQMCSASRDATQTTQTIQQHCVLVAASKPNVLPTVVPRPPCLTLQNPDAESEKKPWIADVDKVAEAFTQVC